jgi:hypothetical protein
VNSSSELIDYFLKKTQRGVGATTAATTSRAV